MPFRRVPAAVFGLLLLSLCQARGDSISTPPDLGGGLGTGNSLPPSDYSLFSSSQTPQWTNWQNIALTGNLLNLVLTLGGDSSQIALLFQPGGVFSQPAVLSQPVVFSQPAVLVAQSIGSSSPIISSVPSLVAESSQVSNVPEPDTMVLLCGSLVMYGFLAYRMRQFKLYVARQRTRQLPDGNLAAKA